MTPPLVAIVGPTASGKSELALHIATTFSGEIVNCDAVQLYRGFDIGTAKTPVAGRRGIPHHLIDVLDPPTRFSAGDYARAAREIVAGISSRGHLPLVVGGTGFYLRGLLEGLPALPGRDEALRERLNAREKRRAGSLHRLLARLEPSAAARIHPRDVQKVTRALEIRLLTQSALPAPSTARPLQGFRVLLMGLAPERSLLAAAIAARTRQMFEAGLTDGLTGGLVEEVRLLLEKGCSGEEKPFESLGYKQALAYLRGHMSLDQAQVSTEIETRQYAKRQLTWFRRDAQIAWFTGFGSDPAVQEKCLESVRKFLEG